jgi:hypothetical protein
LYGRLADFMESRDAIQLNPDATDPRSVWRIGQGESAR